MGVFFVVSRLVSVVLAYVTMQSMNSIQYSDTETLNKPLAKLAYLEANPDVQLAAKEALTSDFQVEDEGPILQGLGQGIVELIITLATGIGVSATYDLLKTKVHGVVDRLRKDPRIERETVVSFKGHNYEATVTIAPNKAVKITERHFENDRWTTVVSEQK